MMKKVPLHRRRKLSKRSALDQPSSVGSKRTNTMKIPSPASFKRPGQFSSAADLFKRCAAKKVSC